MDANKRARLRDEQDRETFAIRRLEREMAEDEPTLEHRLDDLESDIEHAEETVDRDLRAHGFRHVEHPPFWRAGSPEGTVAREPGRDSRDGPATYWIGAGVRCADGPCGELGRVVIDPARRAVTHLVIAPHHREALGRLVPVAMADLDASGITLGTTETRMADLPYAQETEFLPSDPWVSAGPSTAGALAWPSAPAPPTVIVREQLPDGEVSVGAGSHVHAVDGAIGHVRGLIVGSGERVTHVLLHEGHLWGVKDVVIPLADDDRIDDDGVHVSLTKHAIAQLPAVDLEQLAAGR